MDLSQGDASRSMRSGNWDSFCRKHTEVAVCTPVLDLAPQRKFRPELQKSMSFNNWKADEEGHPLVCDAEPLAKVQSGDAKRSLSPTDSQKEKLESLRAAVKSDLRRVMMKRTHSPDSAGIHTSAFVKKRNYPMLPNPRTILPDDDSEDYSRCATEEVVSPWNDSESVSLSDDDLEDYQWEDDSRLISPDSSFSRETWSMQPLDDLSDGPRSEMQMVKFVGNASDYRRPHPHKNKPTNHAPASFLAFSKIPVPAAKSASDINEEEDAPLHSRFRDGIVSAGKKVLTSVWTWAVVTILIAGAKIHSSYSEDRKEEPSPTKYWIESNKLEFDWDYDVEFKFHPSPK